MVHVTDTVHKWHEMVTDTEHKWHEMVTDTVHEWHEIGARIDMQWCTNGTTPQNDPTVAMAGTTTQPITEPSR